MCQDLCVCEANDIPIHDASTQRRKTKRMEDFVVDSDCASSDSVDLKQKLRQNGGRTGKKILRRYLRFAKWGSSVQSSIRLILFPHLHFTTI